MRFFSRLLRFVIATAALAAYTLGPVIGFSYQNIPLYRMAGLTSGLYFSSVVYLFPVFALGLFAVVSLSNRRGVHQSFICVAAVVLLTVGGISYFFLEHMASIEMINLDWLFTKATTLLQVLKAIVFPASENMAFLRGIMINNMLRLCWGYWVSLAMLCVSFISMPRKRRRPV